LKTILLLAAFAVVMAGFFHVRGLKLSHGFVIGGALLAAGYLTPETQPAAA
jgi:hypothetical protein